MEISENERLLLIKKKEEISKITSEIFDIYLDINNKQEVLKRITQIQNCLSILASYALTNKELYNLITDAQWIDSFYDSDSSEFLLQDAIRSFCYSANTIIFDFTPKGVKISIPIKIKEAVLNKIQFGRS
jgi:hypothetical protein